MRKLGNGAGLVTCLVATVALAAACGAPPDGTAGPQSRTLVVADSYPVTHPASTDGIVHFTDRVTELTGGEVDFDYYPSEQLGKAGDYVTLVGNGAIDIGVVSPPYLSDKLPLSNVGDLPGLSSDSCTTAHAVEALTAEDGVLYEEEFAPRGLRPLFVGVVPQYEFMSNVEITEPTQIAGMLTRSPGGVVDQTLRTLGAVPVSIAGPEVYEAMSRGTVDAMTLPPMSAVPFRLDEVASYATEGAPLGGFTLTFAISEALWQDLPDAHRAAMTQAGAETVQNLCEEMTTQTADARATLEAGGMTFTTLSDAQRAEWDRAVTEIRADWVADMEADGRPGAAVLDAMESELERVRSAGDAR
ncbi:TRAP transporter substrate-binding protein DctP [Pseudonocardia nematodicida]|uniref:TRAP transporter substrate-binding protein DctP n=1 Tax=Pseudonocardia nematodicida TaxID=1206997 RepID=A0ABV1KDG3_9PSEU